VRTQEKEHHMKCNPGEDLTRTTLFCTVPVQCVTGLQSLNSEAKSLHGEVQINRCGTGRPVVLVPVVVTHRLHRGLSRTRTKDL
jgi:hypothetical protein